jgi:hypothetical protein
MLTTIIGVCSALAGEAVAADPPSYTVVLGGRTACATPTHRGQARAEGGSIDVQNPSSNAVSLILTGSVSANAYLGYPAESTVTFHVVQEFEITCTDPSVNRVALTLDSSLVGFLRARHKANGAMKLAAAKVCPVGWDSSPLVVAHPSQAVDGRDARLCNQHLPPVVAQGMPLGRYVLTADFVLAADAMGILDAHSAVDFSASTSLPTEWVRTRDPFQGVDKKNFGFSISLTATNPDAPAVTSVTARPEVKGTRTISPARTMPVRSYENNAKGYERLMQLR